MNVPAHIARSAFIAALEQLGIPDVRELEHLEASTGLTLTYYRRDENGALYAIGDQAATETYEVRLS